jgi:dihydropyrimidinase
MDEPIQLVIQGGTVVNAGGRMPATVAVAGGRVVALLDPGTSVAGMGADAEVIDATGKLVLPGGVDPHCHVATELGEFKTTDDYERTSTAALYGGTTTIVDFAIPSGDQRPVDAAAVRTALAADSRCSVAIHGCVRRWDDTTEDQLRELAASGVTTIKLFTTYRELLMVTPDEILAVMRTLRDLGGLTYVHAESNHIIESVQASQAAKGRIGSADHAASRPEISERAAVAEVLAIAEALDAPVYFVHQTTPEVVDLVHEAQRRGVRAYSETCTHYLTLDSSAYAGPYPERYVCCPPLRDPATVAGLRARAVQGAIDTVGSDHCCFHGEDKARAGHDVRVMPYGMPGVESRLAVLFSELVVGEGMSVERFVSLTATTPARLNGLAPRKGAIAVGADADLVVWDAGRQWVVDVDAGHMGMDYDVYQGRTVHGAPEVVVAGGRVVVRDGIFEDPGPIGPRLHAAPVFDGRVPSPA